MALRSALRLAAPLRSRFATTAPRTMVGQFASFQSQMTNTAQMEARRAFVAATLQRQQAAAAPQVPAVSRTATSALSQPAASCPPAAAGNLGAVRAVSSWRLRPYAVAGTAAVTPLSTLSAGFSKVGLSLLVLPWKALPMALVLAPCCWLMPLIYRMVFTNSMRATTASAFSSLMALTISFFPVPTFENLFSDLAFYSVSLVSTFFMYMFFPEIFLNDFMFMHYFALFTIPLIPLAFAYMPMMHARAYLFL